MPSAQPRLHRFWRLCAALLCAAAALTLGFTTFLLRPLKRLSAAAARIAAGQYGQRTNIQTQDEAGTLSRDFDAMAASVQNAMENLAEEVRRRDDFVAAFTHEIKTPMTAMLGYADLLRSRDIGQGAREKAADYVYHETKRLETLEPEAAGADAPWPRGSRAGKRGRMRLCSAMCATPAPGLRGQASPS